MDVLSARSFVHRFVTALVLVVVITAGVIAAAYAQAERKVRAIAVARIDPSILEPGGNFLLIGSDSRAFVDTSNDVRQFGSAQQTTGQRSDTIMVAHVEPNGTALLVSFPRDLWVDIPQIGHAKINAAFNAGPQRVIETIESDFDIPISHYLEVDFAGFRRIVDAIGSIPIYFPAPARDVKSGLYQYQAGCRHLNGDQALAYVRSRYYESLQNGRWSYDPTSDLGRIKRQQYFLRTLAQQTLHTAESQPWRASSIAGTMLANLQRDPTLGFSSLRALAYAFHNPGGVETLTLPTSRHFFDGQDALVLDEAQAAPLLARLRTGGSGGAPAGNSSTAARVSPGSVHVAVRNGSGRTGEGARAVANLRRLGFAAISPATNADRTDYAVTEVRYAPAARAGADLVLASLGGAGRLVQSSTGSGVDVELVIGRDYHGLSQPPAPSARSASPSVGAGSTPTAGSAPGTTVPSVGC